MVWSRKFQHLAVVQASLSEFNFDELKKAV